MTFQNARTRGDPHTHSIQRVHPLHEGLYTCVVGNGTIIFLNQITKFVGNGTIHKNYQMTQFTPALLEMV